MGGHQGRHAPSGGPEGRKFDPFETIASVGKEGQGQVRIQIGIAVSREVFAAGQHPAGGLQALCKGEPMSDDLRGVVAEGAISDHRVGWVRVHIENWREIHTESKGSQLPSQEAPGTLREREIAERRELQHGGQPDHGGPQARYPASLLIHRHEEWGIVGGLVDEARHQCGDFVHLSKVSLK
jgi:hypothetical protein